MGFIRNYWMPFMNDAIAVAMTGASGAEYGLRLLECLLRADYRVYLMVSAPAHVVMTMESGLSLPTRPEEMKVALLEHLKLPDDSPLQVFSKAQWMAPVASGSSVPRAMVVCPCTMGTLAAIAAGLSKTLMERAADVVLKEQKQLILVPRETPFSVIHLENMLKLSRMGATILPANPGFYHQPSGLSDVIDFVVSKILDQLSVPHQLVKPWAE